MRRVTRILRLLRYHARVELVRRIRELRVDILGGCAVLALICQIYLSLIHHFILPFMGTRKMDTREEYW